MKIYNKYFYHDYEYDDFIITIITNSEDNTFEFWLKHKKYCSCYFCFGTSQEDTTYNDFLSMVDNNLLNYIIDYYERVILK